MQSDSEATSTSNVQFQPYDKGAKGDNKSINKQSVDEFIILHTIGQVFKNLSSTKTAFGVSCWIKPTGLVVNAAALFFKKLQL